MEKRVNIFPNGFSASESLDENNVIINGIPTIVFDMSDEHGKFLAIPATDPALSDICGEFVLGKLIKEISYLKCDGRVTVIKAYY